MALRTCIELVVGQRVVLDASSLACEHGVGERILREVCRKRPRRACAIPYSKQETFNRSHKKELFASVRATTAAIDEADDRERVRLTAERGHDLLRRDGTGHVGAARCVTRGE